MEGLFSSVLAKIAAFATWIGSLFTAVFTAAWDFVRDGFSWLFEQLLSIVQSALSTIDVSGVSGQIGAWGTLPASVLSVLGLLGVGTACTIIAAAIAIRLVLQLIPFVRLGS